MCVWESDREKASQPAHNIQPNQSRAVPTQMFFLAVLMLVCWSMWTSHIYVLTDEIWQLTSLFSFNFLCWDNLTSISLFLFFPPFSPLSARSSPVLRRWAHHQELPRHSSRRPAERAPRGRTHRRSVPGRHVHTSPTGHSYSRQQPSAGSAHPQHLRGTRRTNDARKKKQTNKPYILLTVLYMEDFGIPWNDFASLPSLS